LGKSRWKGSRSPVGVEVSAGKKKHEKLVQRRRTGRTQLKSLDNLWGGIKHGKGGNVAKKKSQTGTTGGGS